ncbi:2884_t:CDS:2 [Funneliformis geosporum]|uniref:11971_t:CDS:1 n=1 Tax=Funneliformis geosporum TaxID=1117311 RepID=A0A9W4X0C2_9GLOM|nr:11971_t:CDS:2 [Funneliformis geosporum]CAI2189086.1 2884_t:CDS:2 [Funneliformis geosporum]
MNIRGYEPIPGKILTLICEITIVDNRNAIFVSPSIIRASALQIADERFGSKLCHSDLSANVMVAFLDNENNIEYWPATIRYFFKHLIVLPYVGCTEHTLAMVDWYSKSNKINHFNISRRGLSRVLDGVALNGMRHVELWKPLINKKLSCENIIPVQRIICRFVKSNYCLQNSKTNLTVVILLNRRFSV